MATDRVIVPFELNKISTMELQDMRQRLIESKRDIEMQLSKRRPLADWREKAVLALGHLEKDLVRVKRELLQRTTKKRSNLMPLLDAFFAEVYHSKDIPDNVAEAANNVREAIKKYLK